MKKHFLLLILSVALFLPNIALAINAPSVDAAPSTIDADFYTLIIHTNAGATVSVLGGPSFIPPVTDGAGNDEEDGTVEVTVGLGQNQENIFSIVSELNGATSNSVEVTINEQAVVSGGSQSGDTTAPDKPVLDEIESPIDADSIMIKGSSEADANITIETPDGTRIGSGRASSQGLFGVSVPLERGKTNRLNVYAEDGAGNVGKATQAVIQVLEGVAGAADEVRPEIIAEEPKPELYTTPQFSDVEGHWAKGYIEDLYDMGIVNGKSETLFEPDAYITRAELTKVALNAFNINVNESVDVQPFPDVETNAWFAPFVEKAKELEIVQGFEDGFHPNDAISRAAALKILLEASGLNLVGSGADFSDVPSDAWFEVYVSFAQNNGIVGGYADGTFRPGNKITRAEVIKIVTKILELMDNA